MGDVTGEFFIKELQDHIRRNSGRQNSWENSEKGASKFVVVFHMFSNVMGRGGARPPLFAPIVHFRWV